MDSRAGSVAGSSLPTVCGRLETRQNLRQMDQSTNAPVSVARGFHDAPVAVNEAMHPEINSGCGALCEVLFIIFGSSFDQHFDFQPIAEECGLGHWLSSAD
jgi:hypothetical protein